MTARAIAIVAVLFAMTATAGAAPPAHLLPPDARSVSTAGSQTQFDSAMSAAALDAFYRQALRQEGWSATDDVHNGAALSFYFSRGATAQGSVIFRPRGDLTRVTLTMME